MDKRTQRLNITLRHGQNKNFHLKLKDRRNRLNPLGNFNLNRFFFLYKQALQRVFFYAKQSFTSFRKHKTKNPLKTTLTTCFWKPLYFLLGQSRLLAQLFCLTCSAFISEKPQSMFSVNFIPPCTIVSFQGYFLTDYQIVPALFVSSMHKDKQI